MKKAIAVVTALGIMTLEQALATGVDFTPITGAVDVSTIVVAIVALGAIMMGPNVAKWASKKLAGFFGS